MRRLVLLLAAMALALGLASGVAWALNEVGTNTDYNLSGRGGQDDLFGFGGSDDLLGGQGKDWVLGGGEVRPGGGDKNLAGGPGNDYVLAGKGSDNVVGNGGSDLLIEDHSREFSRDRLSSGPGDDVIDVIHEPAEKDLVVCGRGFDRVIADRKDVSAPDCEKVFVEFACEVHIPESFFRGLPSQLSRFS